MFVQEVSLGSDDSLLALPFASVQDVKENNLSFEWSKKIPNISRRKNLKFNELKFKASSEVFKGFISCDVIKNKNHLFTVFHCLQESEK